MVECIFSMYKTLGIIFSTKKLKANKIKQNNYPKKIAALALVPSRL